MTSRRINAGMPTGGQFATQAHTEGDVSLDAVSGSVEEPAPKVRWINGYATVKLAAPLPDESVFTAPTAGIENYDDQARAQLVASLAAPGREQGEPFVGSKYAGKFQPAAEIAKSIRADLKAAQAMDALPDGVAFGVTSRNFAGGQSVSVQIKKLADQDTTVVNDKTNYVTERSSAEGESLEKPVQAILNAYQRDNSDSQRDHFEVQFYGHVDTQSEYERDREAEEKFDRAQARSGADRADSHQVSATRKKRDDQRLAYMHRARAAVQAVSR